MTMLGKLLCYHSIHSWRYLGVKVYAFEKFKESTCRRCGRWKVRDYKRP